MIFGAHKKLLFCTFNKQLRNNLQNAYIPYFFKLNYFEHITYDVYRFDYGILHHTIYMIRDNRVIHFTLLRLWTVMGPIILSCYDVIFLTMINFYWTQKCLLGQNGDCSVFFVQFEKLFNVKNNIMIEIYKTQKVLSQNEYRLE